MLSELEKIKTDIYRKDLVPKLLESLGCEYISYRGNRVEASRPGGRNTRSVQVYLNKSLTSRVRTRSHIPVGDIYDLVSHLKFNQTDEDGFRKYLHSSKRYIINTLNLDNNYDKNADDPNIWLKRLRNRRKKRIVLSEIEPNETLKESVLNEFIKMPHIDWIREGITYETQEFFDVCFDLQTERICFPVRNRHGEIIGVKGRATNSRDLPDYKYMPIYTFKKSQELYNLHNALPYIKNKNEIIFFESEKSVMKAWQYGYRNSVSQMGSDISRIQAEITRRISTDIKIILAYDKDKSAKEVKQYASIFKDKRNIYGIIDTKDIISDTDSPVDKGKKIWDNLYHNHCYKIF